MKELTASIRKTYKTAWKWPQMYSDDPWVVWSSRIIAIVIPLSIVGLAFITSVPLFGVTAAIAISAIIAAGIVVSTVKLFYSEYPTVESFEAREARIKAFFHGFPSITDVPVIEHEPGVWVAYGHIDEHSFMTAVRSVVSTVTEDEKVVALYDGLESSVGHLYASFSNPREGHWDEGLDLCKPSAEDCFPITRVEV